MENTSLTNSKVIELQEERAGHVTRMREILDAAEAEGRDLNAEERSEYDNLETEVDTKAGRIERARKQMTLESNLGDIEDRGIDPRTLQGGLPSGAVEQIAAAGEAYRSAFGQYLRTGLGEMSSEQRSVLRQGFSRLEERDQFKGTTTSGGFLVPTDFQKQLVLHAVQAGTMRMTRATVIVTQAGETIQIPKTVTHGVASWTAEGSPSSSADETFGQVSLSAFTARRLVKVSFELIEDNAVDLEGYVAKELGRAIGALENTGYINGSGNAQPTGIIVNATLGKAAPTGQTASVTSDDLIDLYYSVPPAYRRNGEWQMADGTLKAVRKLKDSTGNYLWSPAIGGGVASVLANASPDSLLGRPVWDDNDVPAMAVSAKSILFGDYSAFYIRDVGVTGPMPTEKPMGAFLVRRLDERFADSGEVGFLGWHRTDSNLIDQTAAIKYYQNSAS